MSNYQHLRTRRRARLAATAVTASIMLAGSPLMAQAGVSTPSLGIRSYGLERVPAQLKFQARISQARIPVGDGTFATISVELRGAGPVVCSQTFNNVAVTDSVLNIDINALSCTGGAPADEVIAQNENMHLVLCISGNCLAPVALGSVPYAIKSSFSHQAHEARLAEVSGQAHYAHRLSADLDMLTAGGLGTGYFQAATPDASYVPGMDDIYTDFTPYLHDGFIAWAPSSSAAGNQLNICGKDSLGHLVDLDGLVIHAAYTRLEGELEVMGNAFARGMHATEDLHVGRCTESPVLDGQPELCVGASGAEPPATVATTFEGIVTFDGAVAVGGTASFPGGLTAPIDSIDEPALQTGAVSTRAIADRTITGADIAPAAITGSHISSYAIDAERLATGSVSSRAIAPGAIEGVDIAPGAITGWKVADRSIAEADFVAGAVSGRAIADGAVTGPHIASGAVDGSKLASHSITETHFGYTHVSSRAIADGAVTGADIAARTVAEPDLATGAVSGGAIASSAVTAAAIATGAVGPEHLSAAVYESLSVVFRDGWTVEIARGSDVDCGGGTCIAVDGDRYWRWTGAWNQVPGVGVAVRTIATDGNGRWLAVGNNGGAARSDTDGISWTDVSTLLAHTFCSDVAYGGGLWLAACTYSYPVFPYTKQARILVYNGASGVWSQVNLGPQVNMTTHGLFGIGYSAHGQTWVAVGRGANHGSSLWTHSGGGSPTSASAWKELSLLVPSRITVLTAVASDENGTWVAAGDGGIVVSTNSAVSWSAPSIGGDYKSVQHSDRYGWLVTSRALTMSKPYLTSADGVTWRTRWGHSRVTRLAREGASLIGIFHGYPGFVTRLKPFTP